MHFVRVAIERVEIARNEGTGPIRGVEIAVYKKQVGGYGEQNVEDVQQKQQVQRQ